MSDPFTLYVQMTAHEGQAEAAGDILDRLADDVGENEAEVLDYRTYSDGHGRFWSIQMFASSEAFLKHMARPSVASALQAMMKVADTTGMTVLGDVTESVQVALAPSQPDFGAVFTGFMRLHAHH